MGAGFFMSESILYNPNLSREERYKQIIPQLQSLFENENNEIANMANLTSVLKEVFGWLWVGFYLKDKDNLVLGPFQGPLACTRIAFNKGVCGKAYSSESSIIVPNVDEFPGHIACSSLSKSEIVIPGIKEGKVEFVLDIDSDKINDFDKVDQKYLEEIVGLLV